MEEVFQIAPASFVGRFYQTQSFLGHHQCTEVEIQQHCRIEALSGHGNKVEAQEKPVPFVFYISE